MRETPTWRIPFGIIPLFAGLMIYGVVIARYAPSLIGGWSGGAQTVVYVVLGLVWLLPLKRFLIWMETGSWSAPAAGEAEQGGAQQGEAPGDQP